MSGPAHAVDIDAMIATLPRQEQVVVRRLRALVLACMPQAAEKMYEGQVMPFYTRNKLICFILPPSAPLEPGSPSEKQQAKGVALGFNQGYLLANEDGVLLAEGRKQVYMMYFKTLDDIDEHRVCALLYEAAMVDEQFTKKKKRS